MKNNPNSTMISFKESFLGYNKEDVNKYLREINRNFTQLEDDYKYEIESLNEKIKKYEESGVVIETSEEKNSLLHEIEELKSKNDKLIRSLEEKESLLSELRENVGKNDESEQKASLYDKMSNEIGNVFISANESAQMLINDANVSAQKIKDDASVEADKMLDEASRRVDSVIEGIKAQIDELAKKYLEDYSAIANDFKSSVDDVFSKSFESAEAKRQKTQIKLDALKSEAALTIAKEIEKL